MQLPNLEKRGGVNYFRVLVLDDDLGTTMRHLRIHLEQIRERLKSSNHIHLDLNFCETAFATRGEEESGIAFAERLRSEGKNIHLAMIDHRFEGEDKSGYDFCKEFRKLHPEAFWFFLTNYHYKFLDDLKGEIPPEAATASSDRQLAIFHKQSRDKKDMVTYDNLSVWIETFLRRYGESLIFHREKAPSRVWITKKSHRDILGWSRTSLLRRGEPSYFLREVANNLYTDDLISVEGIELDGVLILRVKDWPMQPEHPSFDYWMGRKFHKIVHAEDPPTSGPTARPGFRAFMGLTCLCLLNQYAGGFSRPILCSIKELESTDNQPAPQDVRWDLHQDGWETLPEQWREGWDVVRLLKWPSGYTYNLPLAVAHAFKSIRVPLFRNISMEWQDFVLRTEHSDWKFSLEVDSDSFA